MVCHDCYKQLKKGQKFVRYEGVKDNSGDEVVKCQTCYEKKAKLTNYQACDVYSRVVGFHTPIRRWNKGKASEWKDRKTYVVEKKAVCTA